MGIFKRNKQTLSGNTGHGASHDKKAERNKRRFSCFRKSEAPLQRNGTDESSCQTDHNMTPLSSRNTLSSPLNQRTLMARRLSFDTAQVLMTEAKIQEEIQKLTKNDSNDSKPIRLMSEAGVLLFEGLPEDIPDDKSLKEMIQNMPGRDLFADKVPLFVAAPREYDPIESGFYKPRVGKSRSFYESDGEESMYESPFDNLMKKNGLLDDLERQREVYESWQTSIEPSIEVVIDAKNPLWML